MKLLPVHCCCTPIIRLGYVEVPDDRTMLGQIVFVIPPRFSSARIPADRVGFDGAMDPGAKIYTTIELLGTSKGDAILAVKSAHLDLETWQRVPGFRLEP